MTGFIDLSNLDILIRLFMALGLGAVIGIERVLAHKAAGMRTFAAVSMGSALFIIIALLVSQNFIGISNFDPLRVASQIIVGVGFLGAGLIIFQEQKLVGLTTASGLWVSAGVGMAAGYGLMNVAVIATILTVFIFAVLWPIEQYVRKIGARFKK